MELKPQCEQLEIKIAPATFTWTGAAGVPAWSNPGNWSHTGTPNNSVPTAPGDQIFFPVLASDKTSTNDLPVGSTFASITIQDSSYTLSGNPLNLSGGLSYNGGSAGATYGIPTTFTSASTISDQNGPLTISGPITLGANETVSVATSGSLTVSGGIGESSLGSGSLTKIGGGTLSLESTGSYTGVTTVSAGELRVDGTSAGSAVALGSGTTLSGIGSVGAVTSTGGIIAPGDGAIGTLTVAGLSLDSATHLNEDVVSATSYDQIVSSGPIALGNAILTPTFNGTTPASTSTDRLVIVENSPGAAINGTFNQLPENGLVTNGGVNS